jgi:hypothetical protein
MIRMLTAACLAFILETCALAQCHAPDYLQGGTLFDSKSEIITNISVNVQDFTPNKLACLARSLKEHYRGRNRVIVSIFSSQAAATYLVSAVLPPEPDAEDYEMFKQLHASYVFRTDIHDDYVLLMPDPMIDNAASPINTKIDLSTATIPPCQLQINARCLLEFDHIDLVGHEATSTVTLTAEIERSGSVSDVQVVGTDKNSSNAQQAFADFAAHNLKSWWFESSRNKDGIRIVYSIERVTTPLEHGINVQFVLPDRVNIKLGPMSMTR